MARDINSVILVGRLTRDPEFSYTQNQTPFCRFSIANNRMGANQQEEVNFFDIITWDKIATTCSQYLKKGRQVVIEGRLKQDRFQDQSGVSKSRVEIVASSVQFIGSSNQGSSSPVPTSSAGGDQAPSNGGIPLDGFDDDSIDDEVPF